MDILTIDFPMQTLDAFKFSLMNCSFFHGPKSLSFDETKELLEKNGDFLIQVFKYFFDKKNFHIF